MNTAIGGDLAPVLLTCQTRSFVDGVEVTGARQARPRSMVFLGYAGADKGKRFKRRKKPIKSTMYLSLEVKGPSGPRFLVGGPLGLLTLSIVPFAFRPCDP